MPAPALTPVFKFDKDMPETMALPILKLPFVLSALTAEVGKLVGFIAVLGGG